MGGLLILTMAAISFLIFTERSAQAFTVLGVTRGVRGDRLRRRLRQDLQQALARARGPLEARAARADLGRARLRRAPRGALDAPLPAADRHRTSTSAGAGTRLVFLVLAGSTSAVNLTDGLDGLAAGTSAIAFLAYTALATIGWQLSRTVCADGVSSCLYVGPEGDSARLDLAVFAAAMLGCCIGFLWYNSFPAQVFMGDTGSLGLGGALGALAVLTKTELLLPIIGGVFVVEALSVIIQVISFRRYGRRIFLMAPIHHHFEMKAWSETTIIVRFWIVAALLAGSAFVLAYLRFDQYT